MSRRIIGLVLALVVFFATGISLWAYTRESGEPALSLLEVDGEVDVDRSGTAVKAKAGLPLEPSDHLATGPASRAVLGLGPSTRIRIGETSSLQVVSVDEEGVRLELEDGTLTATVRPESGAVRVGNDGREVFSTGGEFAFAVEDGVIAANAIEGDLMMQGVDAVRLDAGSRATIARSHAAVGPIPEELLLSVQWPDAVPTRETRSVFGGTTAPGARVQIIGPEGTVETRADDEGRFEVEVDLAEGENEVKVVARDLFGKQVEVDGQLQTRKTSGPAFSGGVEYDR